MGAIVQWLDQMVNTMLLNSVATNLERITAAIWLPLELGVTIGLLFYGYLIATQQIPTPFGQALGNIVKVLIVVGLIESGGFYQTQIMGAMLSLPDGLMQVIMGGPGDARDILSEFHNSGLETATRLEERAPSFWTEMGRTVLFSLVSLAIVLMYTLVTVIGLLLMTVAKVGMALIVTVGPFFIAAALWEPTKEFFRYWLQQALYFAFYGMLFTSVFSIVMGMLSHIQAILVYMVGADEVNILQILAVIFLVSSVAIFLLKMPSVIVGKVTGGFSVDMPFIGKI
ncbi:type IV secretion system protein [Pusillimonas caeni]|uniref:type IV secretion system protein n=1 Tax=Pusillimonas caeni TaxID=1348472 RepID=UPI0014322ADA|nr:type IV secretion system protein [Pusillimonas caeni]